MGSFATTLSLARSSRTNSGLGLRGALRSGGRSSASRSAPEAQLPKLDLVGRCRVRLPGLGPLVGHDDDQALAAAVERRQGDLARRGNPGDLIRGQVVQGHLELLLALAPGIVQAVAVGVHADAEHDPLAGRIEDVHREHHHRDVVPRVRRDLQDLLFVRLDVPQDQIVRPPFPAAGIRLHRPPSNVEQLRVVGAELHRPQAAVLPDGRVRRQHEDLLRLDEPRLRRIAFRGDAREARCRDSNQRCPYDQKRIPHCHLPAKQTPGRSFLRAILPGGCHGCGVCSRAWRCASAQAGRTRHRAQERGGSRPADTTRRLSKRGRGVRSTGY